jgi:hypothetical protein
MPPWTLSLHQSCCCCTIMLHMHGAAFSTPKRTLQCKHQVGRHKTNYSDVRGKPSSRLSAVYSHTAASTSSAALQHSDTPRKGNVQAIYVFGILVLVLLRKTCQHHAVLPALLDNVAKNSQWRF